jgi:hypothetical protein
MSSLLGAGLLTLPLVVCCHWLRRPFATRLAGHSAPLDAPYVRPVAEIRYSALDGRMGEEVMRSPFRKKSCIGIGPHAERDERALSRALQLEVKRVCRALEEEWAKGAKNLKFDADGLCRRKLDGYVLLYRLSRPQDYSQRCGRSLVLWVERIELLISDGV